MNVWLAAGLRTPFAKADGALRDYDAIEISVPVVQAMIGQLRGASPDFAVWGTVLPNLTWSNIAREVLLDAKVDPTIPAFSTVMACSTSMMGVLEAAGMLNDRNRTLALAGGSESLSQIQIGLSRRASNWLRGFTQARSGSDKVRALATLRPRDVGLYVPKVANRVTGMSMGEHMEVTAKEFASATRAAQDQVALDSHRNAVAAWERGFFDDLVIPFAGVRRDTIPRADTSFEKLARLAPAFDRTSGRGTITAGNASPLTDGAAGIWVATDAGLAKLPVALPRVRMVDYEIASIDIWNEGLLMAPAYAIPRLLARNNLRYDDIALWEIHEAFAAQVLAHLEALETHVELGTITRGRINPNGGTIAIGHPFGATGARILSQAVKELAAMPKGSRAIVSICADGGQGSVALLEA
ncbi:MAG TPA: acetyl-CoA C-acyltransferase [Candidatus Baltobacteraceae bacterium]|nr:acetyl-CoA C-acyltransferase [Candidatus Baltobacteraceae bacterium]